MNFGGEAPSITVRLTDCFCRFRSVDSIEELAFRIVACRLCDQAGISVRHATTMNRGTGRDLLIVGIEPGNTELRTGEAFSGVAGKRLVEWLVHVGVGANRAEVLARAHLTSLCKCAIETKPKLMLAIRNCSSYLEEQIAILQPKVLLTLGKEPLEAIAGTHLSLGTYIGRTWHESDFGKLFPVLPADCKIVPLPHPSPRSTWLNSPIHRKLLDCALNELKQALKKE